MRKLWGRYLKMNSAVSLDIIKSGPYAGAKAIPQILGGTFFLSYRLHFNKFICILNLAKLSGKHSRPGGLKD